MLCLGGSLKANKQRDTSSAFTLVANVVNEHSGNYYFFNLLQQKDVKKDLLLCFSSITLQLCFQQNVMLLVVSNTSP